jgi:hypothetical protein
MKPVNITLEDHYQGDSWVGMGIGPVLINDAQPPNTLSSCKLQFRDKFGQLGAILSTAPAAGEGTITIDNATTWEASIAPQLLSLPRPGIWTWDFQTTDSAGIRRTLYSGKIRVRGEVTK